MWPTNSLPIFVVDVDATPEGKTCRGGYGRGRGRPVHIKQNPHGGNPRVPKRCIKGVMLREAYIE